MRRSIETILLSGLACGLLLLAASANAGYWEVVYDLAPGSSVTTTSPLGPDTDPMSGTFKVEYDATSTGAPLTGARLMSGAFHVSIDQTIGTTPGLLTITGDTDTTLSPPASGTPGTLSAANLVLSPIPDSSSTGFIHCYGSACGIAGFTASVTVPQTPTGPGPFPVTFNDWVFTTGTAGVGDWTAPTQTTVTQTPSGITVTVQQDFVGREISRVFVPEPGSTLGLLSGTLALAGLKRRRERRSRA